MKKLTNKTVLITGATGLIGSHLVDFMMCVENVKVIALSRNRKKLTEGFKEYIGNDRFSFMEFDVAEEFIAEIKDTIDYIFHAAGPMENHIIANSPVDVIKPNLNGTINCLELLRRQKELTGRTGRLVLFSSVTVYANHTKGDITVSEDETNITENLESESAAYSQSKRMSEVIVHAYRKQYGIDAVIARLSTVYGNTRFRPDTAFFQFINTAVSHKNIIMNKSGIGRRDNIYIEDAIEGLISICIFGQDGWAYNISSNGELGNFAAIDEIGKIITDYVNQRFQYTEYDAVSVIYKDGGKNPRKPGLKLDNSRLKKLNWNIKTGLKDGIYKTIDAILDHESEKGVVCYDNY